MRGRPLRHQRTKVSRSQLRSDLNHDLLSAPRGSFLGRLYGLVAGERHRLEDFLTEVLGQILGSLSTEDLHRFFFDFFLADSYNGKYRDWKASLRTGKSLVIRTQHPILV